MGSHPISHLPCKISGSASDWHTYSSSADGWDHCYLITSLQLHSLIRTNVLLVHSYENILLNLGESEILNHGTMIELSEYFMRLVTNLWNICKIEATVWFKLSHTTWYCLYELILTLDKQRGFPLATVFQSGQWRAVLSWLLRLQLAHDSLQRTTDSPVGHIHHRWSSQLENTQHSTGIPALFHPFIAIALWLLTQQKWLAPPTYHARVFGGGVLAWGRAAGRSFSTRRTCVTPHHPSLSCLCCSRYRSFARQSALFKPPSSAISPSEAG